jgi:hypothetical protein
MLSGQEESAFAEIAEQIAADDPDFAESMRRLQARRPGGGHAAVMVAATATAVLCLALSLPLPGLAAAVLAWAAYGLRPHRPYRPTRRSAHCLRRRSR